MLDQAAAPVTTPSAPEIVPASTGGNIHWGTILFITIAVIWVGTNAIEGWKRMKQLKKENADQSREIDELKAQLQNASGPSRTSATTW